MKRRQCIFSAILFCILGSLAASNNATGAAWMDEGRRPVGDLTVVQFFPGPVCIGAGCFSKELREQGEFEKRPSLMDNVEELRKLPPGKDSYWFVQYYGSRIGLECDKVANVFETAESVDECNKASRICENDLRLLGGEKHSACTTTCNRERREALRNREDHVAMGHNSCMSTCDDMFAMHRVGSHHVSKAGMQCFDRARRR